MAKAIYNYFQQQLPADLMGIQSTSSLDDLKMQEAVPIVKKTWKELMKNKATVGDKIYENIITKEVTMSRLFMQTNIQQQSGIFMVMMDTVVGFLEDPTTMDDKLVVLGREHVLKYKVKTQNFKHFRQAFMKAIKRYLPWNDRRENAWLWFWDRIITSMSSATQQNHISMLGYDNKLTVEQIIANAHKIHLSFDTALNTDPNGFTNGFYRSLLDEEPDIAALFTNTTFEEQAAKFVSMLNHSIKLLDDTSSFQSELAGLAKQHVEYGVKIEQLQTFGEVLVRKVKELNKKYFEMKRKHKNTKDNDDTKDNDSNEDPYELDILAVPEWDDSFDEAWIWFWRVVVGVFSEGMTKEIKLRAEARNQTKNALEQEDFSNLAD